MYPSKYFNLAQWAQDADDSPLGRIKYQSGVFTRGIGFIRHPAAAAFSAGAPFDFVRLAGQGDPLWTFVYRPDIALGTTTVTGRTVNIGITGATAIQVNTAFNNAVGLVNPIGNPSGAGALLNMIAQSHSAPNDDQVTLTSLARTGTLDVAGITAVAGYAAFGIFPGTGDGVGRSKPRGIIRPVAGASLVDTETFIITAPDMVTPGNVTTRTFEFDSGGVVTPGNVLVPFTGGDSIDTVAANIVARINSSAAPPNGSGPTFGVTARYDSAQAAIFLTADIPGSLGGSLFSFAGITETVANVAFAVAGMGGGQDGSIMVPLRWGLSRGAFPIPFGFETEQVE